MIPAPGDVIVTDAGRRLADAVNLAAVAGDYGRWVAGRLIDGATDGQVYDTRADAIRHQIHEQLCCYVRVPPGGMPEPEAQRWIDLNRMLYDAGARLADPTSDRVIVPTLRQEFGGALNRAGRRALRRANRLSVIHDMIRRTGR